MNFIFGVLTVVAMEAPAPQRADADTVRELMAIERIVAPHLRGRFGTRRVGLEAQAQEFGTPHDPTGPERAEYRTAEHLTELAQLAGSSRGPQEALLCEGAC